MLWRDRRAPLAALILLAAYAGAILTGLGIAGEWFLGWNATVMGEGMRLLLAVNLLLLCWRMGMRGHFTARWYGLGEEIGRASRRESVWPYGSDPGVVGTL